MIIKLLQSNEKALTVGVIIAVPLLVLGMVLGRIFLKESHYIRCLEFDLLAIYATCFLFALRELYHKPPDQQR